MPGTSGPLMAGPASNQWKHETSSSIRTVQGSSLSDQSRESSDSPCIERLRRLTARGTRPGQPGVGFGAILTLAGRAAHLEAVRRPWRGRCSVAKTDGPSSKLASSRLSYVEYIQTSIGFWETYHHHKEQMAYVASALFLTGAVATTILDIRSLVAGNLLAWIALLGLVVVTVVAGWLFIFWQLRLRQTAASMLRACGLLLAQWLTRPPSPDDLDLEISPSGRPLTQ